MKFRKLKIGALVLFGIIILLSVYLFVFYLSVIDTKNVKIEGYVYDKITKKPVEKAKVLIENYRYESDNGISNYDEYLGIDKIAVYSYKNGFYEMDFDKSAFVVIVVSKNGYNTLMEKGEYSSKYMDFKTYLIKK